MGIFDYGEKPFFVHWKLCKLKIKALGSGSRSLTKCPKNKMKFLRLFISCLFHLEAWGDFPQKLTQLQDNGPKKEGKACQEQNIQESAKKALPVKPIAQSTSMTLATKPMETPRSVPFWAARGRPLPKWPRSDFPARRVLPSRRRYARIFTQTNNPTPRFWRNR